MAEPDNFTFFVHYKERKPWFCSMKALDCIKEVKEELREFALHECSVQEGIEKFVKGGGKLEHNGYRLEADKIFYNDPKAMWGTRNVRFEDYVKSLN